MFENLFGNLEEQQEALREKLESIILETSVSDGAVIVKGNAKREILDIIIDRNKIELDDMEQLQDLLVTAVNDLIAMASEAENEESQKLIHKMMPPGLGGLFGK